jgi:hypothetical protein
MRESRCLPQELGQPSVQVICERVLILFEDEILMTHSPPSVRLRPNSDFSSRR